jgi:hypothetical protein
MSLSLSHSLGTNVDLVISNVGRVLHLVSGIIWVSVFIEHSKVLHFSDTRIDIRSVGLFSCLKIIEVKFSPSLTLMIL